MKNGEAQTRSAPTPLLDESRERCVEFAFSVGANDQKLHTQAGRRLLHVTQLAFGTRIVRIDEHRDGRGLGNHLVQQAEPLRFEPGGELIDPGHVAGGLVKAIDEAGCYRILSDREDDRNRRGCLLCDARAPAPPTANTAT